MNKIPLSVVALAAVSVSATAAEAVSKDEMKQALQAQRDAATTEISRVINEIDNYHGAVKEKYHALISEQQALLNAAYEKAIADVEAGTEGVVLDTATYVDAVKALGGEAKTLEAQYDAWDGMYTGVFKALKDLNNSVKGGLTEAALPYSYAAQKADYDDLKVQELIDAVEADNKTEGGNIEKTEDYKSQIAALTTSLTTFKNKMASTESTAKAKAENKAAYEEVQAAIKAAKDKRNEVRDALVALLPSPVYADWQSEALAKLTEQVTKVINEVEKSNEAANAEEKATTVKDENLQKLRVVTGYDPVDPNPLCTATEIYGKYNDMKDVQENAYAALNAEFKGKFDLFAPVKKAIEESTVEYLNADSTALSKAYQDVKASIESAYNYHKADQLTPSYDDIDVRLAALKTAADKAKADYEAHLASVDKIDAKQTALDDAIKEAKKKTAVGDYVAYDHFTKTSNDLQNKINAEITAEAAAWSTTDASKAGKAVEYAGKVDTNLGKIDIAAYTTNTEAAKTAYTKAKSTIDAADKALNSTKKGELGLKATAEDKTVTIDGNVGSKTYGDAINHFTAQLNGLTTGLDTALKTAEDATPKGHLALLKDAAAKTVANFEGKDMATLTSSYATNKTNFEANLKIAAANKILDEVNARLNSAKTDLDAAIDATVDYGVKGDEISNEKDGLDDDYNELKGNYDALATWQADDKDASEVIASLNALNEDLTKLQESAAALKAKAESAAKNKTAYDAACGYITAAANAITAANTVIDKASNVLTDDYRGQTYFDNTTGVLSKLTTRKNDLQTAVNEAYNAAEQTVADKLEVAETGFKALAEKIKAEANAAKTNFTDNETFHKNHVVARDAELEAVKALYDDISAKDETTAANDYLADLAKLQEQLLNMTNPDAKGIITEKLAAGLSKQDNQEVLDAIKAIADQRIEIRDTQKDEYKQNVLDDNDAELGVFDAAYQKAYKAFQDAVKTLNDYAAISYNDDVKAIAQADLIATHYKIYGQAAPLLDQKTKANADYNEKCNLETPEFFKSADYVAAVVAIENQINSDINAYVKKVNAKAAELAQTALDAAKSARDAAKLDDTYTNFEYAAADKAFKDVDDLITLVEGKLADDAETGTDDPKFAVNLDKQNWLKDLKAVNSKIAADQLTAAKAEYDHQLEQTNALVEAEQNAIKALGNIDTDEWLATFATNELKNTVTAATEKAKKEGVKYSNIDAIKALLAAFKTSMTDDGNGKLHTATYYDAKQANDAAGENAEAVTKLNQKISAAVKVVDDLGDWLDALFVAHTDPAGASIAAYQTLADQVNGIEEGYTDEVKDGGAVGYLRRYQGILDAAANDAKDIKKAALGEELEAVKGLIENAEEKYNQYAKQDLEGASKFDDRMTTAGTTLGAINTLYNNIVAGTETKKTYDDVKTQVLTLESDIAKLDGELAKKMNSKVIANAHNELTASITTAEANIAAAQTKAQKYDAINAVFGKALGDLSADLTKLSEKEAQLYTDAALLMYVDNLNNDLKVINNALAELKNSTSTKEGLNKMYTRFEKNEQYNASLKAELEGYQTELNRVKEAVADYKSISADWKAGYVDEIEGMIAEETEALNAIYTGITAEDSNSGVNASTTIAQAQDIQDMTIEFEYQAAGNEYRSLSNTLTFTVDDANDLFNNIVLGNVDGKRYNPAAQKELASTLTELQNSVSHVAEYAETLTEFGNDENNPYGYVDVDLNGAPIALNPETDEPMPVQRYFLEAWYNEIHAALNTLIGGANEVAGDVENRAFVLGDVNNNGVINVADYDAVRRMILSADMKKFDDAVRIFGEVPAYAADVNEDKAIDVADLTSISNFIFNGGFDQTEVARAARVKTAGKVMCDDVVTLQAVAEETTLTGKTMRLAVNVANTTDYVNFQMDVQLPEGMTLVGESLSERANGHLLSTADLGNGAFRMVAENVENVAFGNQTNAVLYLDVEVSSNYNAGEVALSNIIFSDAKGNAYRMNGLTTNAPTGINEITAPNMKERIYSVGGQVMKAMKKGVNIIKGEGSVKKVVKK